MHGEELTTLSGIHHLFLMIFAILSLLQFRSICSSGIATASFQRVCIAMDCSSHCDLVDTHATDAHFYEDGGKQYDYAGKYEYADAVICLFRSKVSSTSTVISSGTVATVWILVPAMAKRG